MKLLNLNIAIKWIVLQILKTTNFQDQIKVLAVVCIKEIKRTERIRILQKEKGKGIEKKEKAGKSTQMMIKVNQVLMTNPTLKIINHLMIKTLKNLAHILTIQFLKNCLRNKIQIKVNIS